MQTKLMMSCLSWSCLIKYNPRVFCCCFLALGQSGQWNQQAYLSPQQASMRSAASPGVAGRRYAPLPHPIKPVYARYSTDTHIWNNDYTPRKVLKLLGPNMCIISSETQDCQLPSIIWNSKTNMNENTKIRLAFCKNKIKTVKELFLSDLSLRNYFHLSNLSKQLNYISKH